MKRTNPTTKEPFKRGDARDDSFVFYAYTKIVKSDGFFKEIWLNPNSSKSIKEKDRAAKRAKYQKKTNRHLPGFDNLSAKQKATVHMLHKLGSEWKEYGDMTLEMVAEDLIGYEIDSGPELDEAIRHAGALPFDAKEAFRISLSA
jgi:hypothetical protein